MTVSKSIDHNSQTLTIRISGNFDFTVHPDFRNAYKDLDKNHRIIVDLKDTEYLDSAGLGMLLLMKEEFPQQQHRIINCKHYVKQILEIACFEKSFDIS